MTPAPCPPCAADDLRDHPWHLVGAGRMGAALAHGLLAHGVPAVSLWTRSAARRDALPAHLAARTRTDAEGLLPPTTPGAPAPVVVLAVRDDALPRMVQVLASLRPPRATWLHVSGASPVALLAPLPGSAGALHPLQSMGGDPVADAAALAGAVAGVGGDLQGIATARWLCDTLGLVALDLADDQRAAWHACAVLVGNGVSALLQAARTLANIAGLDADGMRPGLALLAARSADNARHRPLAEVTTGPIARGDAGTIRRHRALLARTAPALDPLYGLLARQLVEIARDAGLPEASLRALEQVLEDPDPAP
jgi:predicted short-subunit dehydrogenase-like oxidoreductase (DUF2520 family)